MKKIILSLALLLMFCGGLLAERIEYFDSTYYNSVTGETGNWRFASDSNPLPVVLSSEISIDSLSLTTDTTGLLGTSDFYDAVIGNDTTVGNLIQGITISDSTSFVYGNIGSDSKIVTQTTQKINPVTKAVIWTEIYTFYYDVNGDLIGIGLQ